MNLVKILNQDKKKLKVAYKNILAILRIENQVNLMDLIQQKREINN